MTEMEDGVVVATRGRRFEVRANSGDRIQCEVRQKVKTATIGETPVAVGDDVRIARFDDGTGAIEEVKPRRTMFFRPQVTARGVSEDQRQVLAANLDQLAIVVSIQSPPLKTGLIDRFLIAADMGNLTPLLVINKIDLKRPADIDDIVAAYTALGTAVFPTSVIDDCGLDDLRAALVNHRSLFAGHSGVGKSSILNALLPDLNLKVDEVSEASNRGKHTTTSIELFELPRGGYVVDSPGLKVMGLWDVKKENLTAYYREFDAFAADCRFSSCSHSHEPDCAVKAAVETGDIPRFRYENYLAIYESL